MTPEEEPVHVLSRVDILEPFSDEELRELLWRNLDTYLQAGEIFYSPEGAKDGLRILQQSGLAALPVTENGELVGMLTIEDIGEANLLRDLRQEGL